VNSALDILNERITAAMAKVTGRQDCAAIVRPATDPRFGDYQANGVMALAKQLKTNPRKLAEEVVAQLDLGDICEPPEVAGPGFINLRIKPPYIAGQLLRINGDKPDCLGIEKATEPQTVVIFAARSSSIDSVDCLNSSVTGSSVKTTSATGEPNSAALFSAFGISAWERNTANLTIERNWQISERVSRIETDYWRSASGYAIATRWIGVRTRNVNLEMGRECSGHSCRGCFVERRTLS